LIQRKPWNAELRSFVADHGYAGDAVASWRANHGGLGLQSTMGECQMASRRLEKSEWQAFLNRASKGLAGKSAEVEVGSLALGQQIQAEWVGLIGVVYDPRNDIVEIALDGLDHIIRQPKQISVEEIGAGLASLEVRDASGTVTIVKLRQPLLLTAS
jgi:Family of unknown function (DUF5335)